MRSIGLECYISRGKSILLKEVAMKWLQQAAEQKNEWAFYQLGKLYLSGEHVTKNVETAVHYLGLCAEKGNQYAQYMLGKLYLTGQSVQPDQVQAIVWFGRSAEGNQYAQFFLERHDDIRPPSVMLAVTRLLYHMSRSFEDCSLPRSSTGLRIDRKRRQKLQARRIALGHKPDDHEDE